MSNSVVPSDFYPGYFKLELEAASDLSMAPAKALDAALENFLVVAQKRAISAIPSFFDNDQQQTVMRSLGFKVEELESIALEKLYESCQQILSRRGTVKAVKLLAEIYFGKTDVFRGRPYPRKKLTASKGGGLRLCDSEDKRNTIFVRLHDEAKQSAVSEFIHNSRLLVPYKYQILVAQPKQANLKASGKISLAKPLTIKERRL